MLSIYCEMTEERRTKCWSYLIITIINFFDETVAGELEKNFLRNVDEMRLWWKLPVGAIDSKYLLTFQLLNYSNPYSRLNIGDQEYRCLYTYHTWQPKRLEHFKCRLIFTVLISPSSPSDIPYLSTTKMISLPADGDHKGTIDFAEEISLEKCSIPIKCTESTWTRPVQLKFETRPKWIRVLVEHVGSLVVDSTDRLVNLNQKFLVDDFWIDLAQQQYYDDANLAYLVGLSPTTEECDSCNSGVFVDHSKQILKLYIRLKLTCCYN
uniref:Uncharacterized protein n=1 Tax=Romanomermis culicivorax TaxID=13658 RepID=A0A915KTY5_ROMCU